MRQKLLCFLLRKAVERILQYLFSGTPAGTYRPHIVIGDPQQRKAIVVGNEIRETYLGVVFVSGPDHVVLGEPLEAEAVLMYYPLAEHDAVVPGATFTIREGARVVGYGRVSRVFIPDDVEQSICGCRVKQFLLSPRRKQVVVNPFSAAPPDTSPRHAQGGRIGNQ